MINAEIAWALYQIAASGELKNVPGLDKNIIAKIGEMLESGECQLHRTLKEEMPASLLDLVVLPGLGAKRAKLLYERLKITNIAELEQAARDKQVRELPGIGIKTGQNLIQEKLIFGLTL